MATARRLRLRSRSRSMSPRKEWVRKKSRKRRAGAESPTRLGDMTNTSQKKACCKPIWDQVTIDNEDDIKFDIIRKVSKKKKKHSSHSNHGDSSSNHGDSHYREEEDGDSWFQKKRGNHGNHTEEISQNAWFQIPKLEDNSHSNHDGSHSNHGSHDDNHGSHRNYDGNHGNKRKDLRLKLEVEDEQPAVAHKQPLDIPVLGLSTFKIRGAETMRRALDAALNYGYRLFDMTSNTNEQNIGTALKHVLPHHGLKREDIYLIIKLQLWDFTYNDVLSAVEHTLVQLQTDYIDVVLLQWPQNADLETILECYRALEALHHQGQIKELGAYKFSRHQLEMLIHNCSVIPAMLQAEFHPYLYQEDLVDICREYSIRMQAFCFIKVLQDPVIIKLARIYDKAPSQIILRWIIQHGVGVLPKSKTPDHIGENAQIFDFCLTPQDMDWINSLNRGISFTPR